MEPKIYTPDQREAGIAAVVADMRDLLERDAHFGVYIIHEDQRVAMLSILRGEPVDPAYLDWFLQLFKDE